MPNYYYNTLIVTGPDTTEFQARTKDEKLGTSWPGWVSDFTKLWQDEDCVILRFTTPYGGALPIVQELQRDFSDLTFALHVVDEGGVVGVST